MKNSFQGLKECLTRKRGVVQITHQCHYEWLISVVLSYCYYNFLMTKFSVFSRIIDPRVESHYVNRKCSRKTKCTWNPACLLLPHLWLETVNKSKVETMIIDSKIFLSLVKIVTKLDGVFQHTHIKTGVAILLNYKCLSTGFDNDDGHCAIVSTRPPL